MYILVHATEQEEDDEETVRIKEQGILELGQLLSKTGKARGMKIVLLRHLWFWWCTTLLL